MDLRDIKEFAKDTLSYILTAGAVFFVIIYVVTLQQVVGPSMDSTLKNQDVVILFKSHYKLFDMKRFDIIAFNYADTKYLIKRVIGLPGDKVEYKNNVLYINGKEIEEEFLEGHKTNDFNTLSLGYETIPEGKYLVLGDNRENSLDSRSFGLIDEKDILGKVTIKIWPFYEFDIVN